MREREINLKDLLTAILLKWRIFVVLILVSAVAFGVDYASSWKAKEAQKARTEQTAQGGWKGKRQRKRLRKKKSYRSWKRSLRIRRSAP